MFERLVTESFASMLPNIFAGGPDRTAMLTSSLSNTRKNTVLNAGQTILSSGQCNAGGGYLKAAGRNSEAYYAIIAKVGG
jgi:hypothetical protein